MHQGEDFAQGEGCAGSEGVLEGRKLAKRVGSETARFATIAVHTITSGLGKMVGARRTISRQEVKYDLLIVGRKQGSGSNKVKRKPN